MTKKTKKDQNEFVTMSLSLPRELVHEVRAAAERESRSFSNFVTLKLKEAMAKSEPVTA